MITVSSSFVLVSLGLTVWQWWEARRFPLHKAQPARHRPPLTLLKPVKGFDSHSRACFESWMQQDYDAPTQILFGVGSADDPVCDVIRGLLQDYPNCDAELVICQPALGLNAKVSSLCHLAKLAKHEHLVVSDADVAVPSYFLASLVEGFESQQAALINCFYRLAEPANFSMRWEAVAINADFWPQVLQGVSLKPMDFALGAVMATTREQLKRVGGFEALLEYLADDYQLGQKVAQAGGRLALCPVPVECRCDPMSFEKVWRHQLRWARTIRVCRTMPYFWSILSNATLWPLLHLVVHPGRSAAALLGASLVVRGLTAVHNSFKLTREFAVSVFWLSWCKDLFQAALWMLSFLGSTISWRGTTYRVTSGGKLQRDDASRGLSLETGSFNAP